LIAPQPFRFQLVAEAVARAGLVPLPESAAEKLACYGNLLVRWNERTNLTAIRDPAAILERHVVESVAVAQLLPTGISTLLDYGSGAGLPGIPIAIVRGEIQVTLAESQSKKVAFLREAVRTLGLTATIHAGRVADLPKGTRFDAVTLRAVEKMPEAVAEGRSWLRPGGSLVICATTGTKDSMLLVAASGVVAEHRLPTAGILLVCSV
jgi:16S rRNA (guanine527-N7)-methyltransferase